MNHCLVEMLGSHGMCCGGLLSSKYAHLFFLLFFFKPKYFNVDLVGNHTAF